MRAAVPFQLKFGDWTLHGDERTGEHRNSVLCIHGAGQGSRQGLAMQRDLLQACGIGSTAIDYIGHGETGGSMQDSSLQTRGRQLDALIAARGLHGPLAVTGSSMGAYDAIRLTTRIEVDALILIVPGIFDPAAWEVPFGPAFSTVIRRHESWRDSDAWNILQNYRGRLLVLSAEHDEVIPAEIPAGLAAAAINASRCHHMLIPGASHRHVFGRLHEDAKLLGQAQAEILATLLPPAAA